MVYWFESVLLYITSCLVHSYGVDPTCECVVYQSYGLSTGQFYSPNYPEPYRHGINCILYTFVGDVNEIVEIDFIDMDLKKRVEMSPTYYECKDFIKVYKNLDRPEVNENSRADATLCGNISDMPQKKFYSQGRGLILEFHTDRTSRETHKGFKGRFTFLDASSFKIDGTLQIPSRCTYNMQSFNNSTRGNFYSPRYPQNYPAMSLCHYRFFGHNSEKVNVTFRIVRLPHRGRRSCDEGGDRIAVYDGKDNTSKLLAMFCETHHNPKSIISSGAYMYIEFKSDRHNQLQGFAAEYSFVNSNFLKDNGDRPKDPEGKNKTLKAKLKLEVQKCNRVIESKTGEMYGTIISPGYPGDYHSSMVCKYTFKGEQHQRVQINFKEMNLHYTGRGAPSDPFQCTDQGDTITVITFIGDKKTELGEYCGQKKPPLLMSTGVKMEVVFKSDSKIKNGVSGYKFDYKFRTDFGVQGNGVQDSRKDVSEQDNGDQELESKEDCIFNYNSSAATTGYFTSPNYPVCTFEFRSRLHTHGYFTSPNYGGLYPRSTECRFLFVGRKNEKVHITFDRFDVDGIRPSCTAGDESDSITFSNYWGTPDRKMPKYCGLNTPLPVQSDSSFFVVTFRSNDVFDATGFMANYSFISTQEAPKEVSQPTTQTNTAYRISAPTSMLTFTLCILFLVCKL